MISNHLQSQYLYYYCKNWIVFTKGPQNDDTLLEDLYKIIHMEGYTSCQKNWPDVFMYTMLLVQNLFESIDKYNSAFTRLGEKASYSNKRNDVFATAFEAMQYAKENQYKPFKILIGYVISYLNLIGTTVKIGDMKLQRLIYNKSNGFVCGSAKEGTTYKEMQRKFDTMFKF